MDLHYIFAVVFFCALIEAKEYLRTGRGDTIGIPDKDENEKPEVLALLIVEHNADLEESNQTMSDDEVMVPWVEQLNPDYDIDTSSEANSEEYKDSDSEIDTGSESNFYHEEDYIKPNFYHEDYAKPTNKVDLSGYVHEADVLRERWRSCQKKAAKVCREACKVAYQNACDENKCRKKLRKSLKKQCKTSCKDFFLS